jgi:hypothetical protein
MNDEIQAIVDLAIKNGYDIKDMSKILSDSGFGAEDISAAESMYDQSKKKSPTQEDLKELQLRSEQEYFASDISSNQPREAAVELYNAVMKGNGTDEVVSQNPDKYNSLYNAYRVTSGDPTVRSLPPSLFDEQGVVNQDAFNRLRRDSYRQLEYQLERDRKAYEEREAEIAKRQESYISVVSPIINGAESILGGVINFAGEVSGSETLSEAGSYLLEDVQLSSIAGMRNSGLTDEEISKGFLNNALEGNIGTSLMILGPQLLQQVPQLALIAATGGTAGITTLGVSSAGSALEQVEGRKDMTSQEKMLYGVGAGLAESLSERLFMGDVRLLRKAFGGANLQNMTKKEIGDLLFAAVPPLVRSTLEEGTEEAVASVAQQTLLNFIAGDEIDPIEIAESAIIGAIMGGSTYVLAKGVNSFGSSANAAEKAAVKKDISDINDAVNDPNISEKERDALSVALTEAQDRLAEIESKDAELYSKMTEEERQELVKINSSILKSINEYRGATHQVFKNQLIRKVESLVEQRNNIERKYYDIAMAVGLDVMYDNPITGQRDNGELIQDGQRVVFRSQTGKEFDIGNIEELADVKPEDVGLVIAQEIVSPQISINKDGSLTYSGEDQAQVKKGDRLRIGSDLGINAIRRRKRGGYKVDAMNDSGQMVSVTGPAAEEIAYQITLAAAQTPAGIEQINQLIQQDEKAQQLLTEAIAANEQRRKNTKPAARPAKEGPKAAVAEPARERVKEEAPAAKEPATPREKMVKAVEDGKAFLKKSLKGVAIVTHDTRADFDKAMNEVSRGKASAPNVVDRGRFIRNTKTGKLEVHINLEQAREADVAHEIFHAVFYKFFGQSEKTAKQFANDLIKVLNTGNKFERGLAQQLDEFIKKGGYTKAEAAEEIIAETAGLLYQNSGKITTSMLDKIALFLNKIAERLKLDPLFTGTRNRAKIVELLNSFASAMSEQTGIDVTRIDDNKVFDKILKESSSKTIEQLFDATKAGLLIHATSGEFDTFDPEKIYGGSRAVYGYGFYFTGWAPKAKDYGNKFIFTPSDKYNLIDVKNKIDSEFVNELIKKSEKIKDPLLSPYVDAIVNEMTSMLADGKSVYIDEVRKRLVNRYKLSDQEFSESFKSLGYDGFSAESALTDYYEVIIFNTEKLNENLVKDEVEYISKEGTQKSFTEAASKIAEKSSKVITAEDKELVLTALKGGYIVHATKSEFRVFDPNRIERTAYGFGFYFTGQDDLAKSYGNRYSFIYSNELNLYEGNATISEAVLNRIKEAAETENEKLLAREIEVLYTRDGGEVRKYNRMNGIPVDVLNQKLIKEAILQGKDPEKAFTVVTNEGLVSIPTSLEAERQLSVLLTKAGIDGFYTEVKEKYLRLGNAIDVAVVFNFEKLNKYVVSIEEIVGDYSRVALENYNIDYDIERSSRVDLPSYAAKKINKAYSELGIKENSELRNLGSGIYGFATYVEDLSEPHPNGLVIKATTSENESNIGLLLVIKYNGELDGIARHYKWAPNTIVDRENISTIKLRTKALITKEYLPVKAQVVGKDGEVIDVSVEDIYKAAELLMIGMSRANRKDMKAIDTGNLYLMENLNSFGDLVALSSEGSYYEEDIQEQETFIKIWNKLIANEDALAAAATAAIEYEFEYQEGDARWFSNIYKNIPPSVFDNLLKSIFSAKRSGYRLGIELLDQHDGNYGFVVDKDGITDGSVKLFDVDARIGASDIVRILKEENIISELTLDVADGLKNIVRVGPKEFSEIIDVGTNQFLYEDRKATYIPVNLPKPAPAEYNFGHGNVDDAYDVREKASREEPETKADKLIDAILNKHWSEIQSGYDVAFGNGMFGTGIYGVGLDGPEHIAEFSMKASEFDGEDIVVLDNFASVEGMIGGKRKGNGRRALRGILRLADEYGVRVKLLASPITMFKDASKATKEKLIKFYASEGFEPMKGGSVGQMIRPVGAQPQKEKPLPLNNERYWGKDTADVTTLEEFIKREEDFDPNYVGEFSQEELDNLPPSIISDMFFDGYNEDYGNIESFEKQGKNESWAFVSPQNRGDKETTPEQNEKALKDAESWFKENDLSPNKVYTMFNGLKRVSFFVPNMSIKQVSKFNEQFEQINSLHSSGIVSQVPMNNSSRLTIEDEYGDPHGVWTVPTDIGYDDNYIVAKKWDGEIAYFKPQYDDGDAVFESEMDMDTPPEDRSSKEVIQSLESGRFEITEDGKGNYVFFHYSPEKIDTVDPKFFGKNAYTSDRRITPISFYYTAPNRQETMVSGDPNVVLVKKEEVYPFTTDPLNLYDEAKKLHDEYYGKIFKGVKKAFDAPSQATWIMRVAADRGYKMLIAAWNDVSRAETPLSMKVDKAATAEFIKSGRKRIYAGEDLRTIGMVDRSSRQVDDMESRIKDREVKSLAQRIKDTVFWNPEQKQVRSLKESMVGDLTVEGWNIRRFNNRLNELLKKNPEASGYVNEILNGYLSPDSAVKLESLSNGKEIADHAYSMRAYIDKFSSDFLNGEEFASFSPELRKVIEKNIGQYVRKSYRFWKDKNFKPTKRARINAIKFEYEALLAKQIQILERSGKTPLEIDEYLDNEKVQGLIDQATGIIDRYIAEAEQIRKGPDFRASGMVRPSSIKLPSQQFMKRKNLPETIQELLGAEKDPLVRFTDTTWALANIKYKAVMLNNMLKQLGPNVIKDTQEVTKSEESSKEFRQIKDEYSPMNGKWVRSDLFEVISDESLYTSDLAWLQLYFNILKVARKSKVVYNIPTWRKNITGGWYTMLANGVLFNQNIVADISNRAKQLYGNAKGKELMQKEIYDQLGVMGKYGLLGTSVDANMIGLMDITMNSAITGEVDDNKAMAYFNKFVSKGKSLDKWATENYSFIDDYTKLVVFRNEVQMTAKKLYGKEYSELSQEELNEVNRYAAERVKENTPTFSRLPRFYKTLAKMPFGDFLSFELEAIRSIYQNTTNGLLDVKKGMSDTSLNDVQKKAYIRSGMSRLVGVSSLLSIRLAITAGIAAAALGDDEDLDEAAKAVRPDWMDGHSLVITNINKNGEVTAYDYSLEDPYGNVFDAVTDPMGLPKHIWELFGPNMAAEFIFNVSKGKDVYGRDIAEKTDGLLNSAYKYTSYGVKYLFVPPAISSYYRDYIKGGSAEKPKDYFTALISRSTIRDYKYNAGAQFSFSTKELSTGKKDFNELSSSGKRVRMKQLEEIRNQYQAIVEIGMSKGNFEMIQRANMSVRRNFSRLERAYIFYGYELK